MKKTARVSQTAHLVALVAHHNLHHLLPAVLLQLGQPDVEVGEGPPVGDIEDQDDPLGPAVVGGADVLEPLLARGVPELEPDCSVLQVHGLRQEVNTDGCLENFHLRTLHWWAGEGLVYLVGVIKTVVHKPRDQRGLPYALLPEEHQLEFPERVAEVS